MHSDAKFIDCCALVRVVVRRMREQLGIRLGPMNQAYQFDTLPVRVGSMAELEPGDLIFYSGTYVNPDTKQHPFDLTHVEIFTGLGSTGEGTIGEAVGDCRCVAAAAAATESVWPAAAVAAAHACAPAHSRVYSCDTPLLQPSSPTTHHRPGSRERCKWVKEYDSYEFTSKRWSLISHFFCKLDPWLEGVCTPQHPELWREPWGTKPVAHPGEPGLSWDAKKYSIFAGDGYEEDADAEGQDAEED